VGQITSSEKEIPETPATSGIGTVAYSLILWFGVG